MPYVNSLDPASPPDNQAVSLGDDRIRETRGGIKERLETVFTGIDVDPLAFQPGIIPGAAIADSAITAAKILDGSVGAFELSDAAVETAKLADSAVTTAKLIDGAVTSAKIGAGEVNTANIADGAVTGPKLGDDTVTDAKIQNLAVTTGKIADGAVTTVKLADGAVTSAKIADGGIATVDIADAAITTDKIADASITAAKLSPSPVLAGRVRIIHASIGAASSNDDAFDWSAEYAVRSSAATTDHILLWKIPILLAPGDKITKIRARLSKTNTAGVTVKLYKVLDAGITMLHNFPDPGVVGWQWWDSGAIAEVIDAVSAYVLEINLTTVLSGVGDDAKFQFAEVTFDQATL